MKFEEFSVVGTEPLGSTTRISCAGGVLRFEGKLTLSLGTAISTAWEVPCLALTGFFVSVKEMQRAKK